MSAEHHQAKKWRQAQGLSQSQLAKLSGYSKEAVYAFERGTNDRHLPHEAHAWQRYTLVCLAISVLRRNNKSITDWQWST